MNAREMQLKLEELERETRALRIGIQDLQERVERLRRGHEIDLEDLKGRVYDVESEVGREEADNG